ncbi:putative GGDEF protein [Vibrio nigripulchritudo MADA3029]|uniref:GGDEF domain-containing protein n=1 Tax=Vibrio nigripulchritudo TaxID=28173 RepID=UPI0003B19003|nr:GGDEF domain-containing protein [Vibrio nigripulchritudo]CCN49713.1 putative GGDEF protein [Vibrio nigripulchritudo MADA3020]CCN54002.1 putative GGDEF protein [Vibrio nigripulchritudo MADA3021]CCN57425.1 putative GGDEF protein [Vibrio nigripulchritudo MADA3029]
MSDKIIKQMLLFELQELTGDEDNIIISRLQSVNCINTAKDIRDLLALLSDPSKHHYLLPLISNIIHNAIVSERKSSYTDKLTGLFNCGYLRHLENSLNDKEFTLFFFDLNGFKKINDTHGHEMGNLALRDFAKALKRSFRLSDIILRYGGDEFIVIVFRDDLDVDTVRNRLAKNLNSQNKRGFSIRFSIGKAVNSCWDFSQTLRSADREMYMDKRRL